ncbi:MAG: hypothetical protein AAFQ62_10400 [Pseudomonadota bacterium]
MISSYLVLKWLHIIAMAYWLGGEWGVFNASRHVTNPTLTLDERKRHMETAYRIDILPRTGIILLLPLGLHMGNRMGVQPLGGAWITGMWVFVAAWVGLTWTAFAKRGTDTGVMLTKLDEAIRYIVIPLLLGFSLWSLVGEGPLKANWYSAKVFIYGLMLVIGLYLRYIMRDWVGAFRQLAADGPNETISAGMERSLAKGRAIAYVYWIGIASVAFLGTVKPNF